MRMYCAPPGVVPTSKTLTMFGWPESAPWPRPRGDALTIDLVEPRPEDLDRNHPVQRLLAGPVDNPKATSADLLDVVEPGNAELDRGGRRLGSLVAHDDALLA